MNHKSDTYLQFQIQFFFGRPPIVTSQMHSTSVSNNQFRIICEVIALKRCEIILLTDKFFLSYFLHKIYTFFIKEEKNR